MRTPFGQLPLELVLPGRVRFGRQSVVGESRLIGDLGDAERGDDQVGDRSAAFRFGDDQRGVRTTEHVDVPPVLIDPHGVAVLDDDIAAAFDEFDGDARIDLPFRLVPRAAHGRALDGDEGLGEQVTATVEHVERVGASVHGDACSAGFQADAQRVVVGVHVIALYNQRRRVAIVELGRHFAAEEATLILEIIHEPSLVRNAAEFRQSYDMSEYRTGLGRLADVRRREEVMPACKVEGHGSVAQWIERLSPEQKVVSSNLIGPTALAPSQSGRGFVISVRLRPGSKRVPV